ncbi:MAG: right-handed parallel beta-helix repeat-containing protein, partial [Thermoplasmata archaeon]
MTRKKVTVIILSALLILTTIQLTTRVESGINIEYYGYIHKINGTVITELSNHNITLTIGPTETYLTTDSYGFYYTTCSQSLPHTVNYTVEWFDPDLGTTTTGYYEFIQTDPVDRRVDPTFIVNNNVWEWFNDPNPPTYKASPHSDLEIVDIRFSNDNPNEGDNITIYADIKNRGESGIVGSNITVSFYNDTEFIQNGTINGLNQNETKNASVSWNNLVAGYHTITVKVDLSNVYLEMREQWNNNRTKNIDVWKWIYGDWYINTTENYSGIPFVVDGNLSIENGGNLTLNNSKLKIKSNYDGEHKINVNNGGELNLMLSDIRGYNISNSYGFEIYDQTKIEWSNVSNIYNGIEIYTTEIIIYGCNIFNSDSSGIYIQNVSDPIIIYNNIYSNSGHGLFFNQSNTSESNNVIIGYNYIHENSGAGIYLTSECNLTLIQDTIDQNNIGIQSENSKLKYIDSIILNSSINDIKLSGNSQMVTVDVTFNQSSVNISNESQLVIKWSMNLKVENANGYAINTPTVILYDTFDNVTHNGTADMNGEIRGIHCTEYIENASSKTYYSPYNITSFKHGGFTGFIVSSINESKDETVIIPGPDLTTVNITLSSNISSGVSTNISANIKNIGNSIVNNITVKFYVGKSPFGGGDTINNKIALNYTIQGNCTISSLSSDTSDNVSVEWVNPEEGMRNVKIEIDYNNTILEIDEDNNYLNQEIYVNSNISKPFPIFGYVYSSNEIIPVKNATVLIENQRTGDNITYITDYLGRYIENLLNMPNGYNDSDTIKITANYNGNYTVNKTITVNSTVGYNQTNLIFTNLNLTLPDPENITIDTGTNVRVDNIIFSDHNLLRNNSVKIIATIFNNGSVNLTNISVKFYVGNYTQIGQEQLINVSSGKYTNAQIIWAPQEPTLIGHGIVLYAEVDPDDNLTEINETDNCLGVVKMVRDLLNFHLNAGVNKVKPDNFTHNLTASAVETMIYGGAKYIVKQNLTTEKYYSFIPGFSNKYKCLSPFIDNLSEE